MVDRYLVFLARSVRLVVTIAMTFAVVELASAGEAGFATARLNIRECPRAATDCPVLGVLDRGAKLEILDRHDSWLRIRVVGEEREGWVAARYVRGASSYSAADSNGTEREGRPKTFLSRVADIAIGLGLLVVIALLGAVAFGPWSPTVRIPGPASGDTPSSNRW